MTDIALRILLQAQDQASRVISGFGNQLLKMSGDFKPLLIGAGLAGAAILGIGAISTKMAADFQTAMLSLVAHAGLAKDQFDNVSNAVLAMAPAVGRAPTELADALYPILSAFSGIQNQAAKAQISLDTLRMSFQTVAGTTTDGTAVARAAVGTFNALGLATNNVGENTRRMTALFDVMDKTVQLGNMTWDDYKSAVTKVALATQGTNVTFNETQAALAEMTNHGFPSAQKASTFLSNLLTTMAIKTDALAKHAKTLKISFDEQKYSSMNLADKIKYLTDITHGNRQEVLALLGNNATALKAFNSLSSGINDYKSNLQSLSHSQGALKSSFDTASQGFSFAMSQAKAAIDVLLVKIGTALLPILTQLVHGIVPIVSWIINFTSAVSKNQVAMAAIKSVLVGVATVIAIVLVNAFIAWAIAAGAAAVATIAATWPILLIGAIVAAVVFGIIMAVQHWGAITTWFGNLWHAIFTGVGNFFSGVGSAIHGVIMGIGNAFSAFGSLVHGIWDGIVDKIKGAINFIIGLINFFIGGIDSIGVDIGPVHIHPNIPKIPYLASGGYIESSGIAMVHAGERVVPARASQFGGGTTGQAVVIGPVNIYGPSRQMADDFLKEISRRLKQQGTLVTWTSGGSAV